MFPHRNATSGGGTKEGNRLRRFSVIAATVLAAASAGMSASSAMATSTPDYVVAVWQQPVSSAWPQSLVTSVTLNTKSLQAGLNKLDLSTLPCGTTFQADLYNNNETTTALLASKALSGPGTSAESWPGGQYKSDYSKTWTTAACAPDTSSQKITFCHATGSDSNPYVKLTTDVGAFYKAGHIDHTGDIYPAGSFTKGGHDFSWKAQGDQSLLQYADCVKPPTPPTPTHVTVSATSAEVCGPNNDTVTSSEAPAGVTKSDTGWVNGERTISYVSNDVSKVVIDGQSTFKFTDANVTCSTATPTPTPTTTTVVTTPAPTSTTTATYPVAANTDGQGVPLQKQPIFWLMLALLFGGVALVSGRRGRGTTNR